MFNWKLLYPPLTEGIELRQTKVLGQATGPIGPPPIANLAYTKSLLWNKNE